MTNVKTYKRGETLYKENEKATALFLVQSGTVQLVLARGKQSVELCQVGAPQLIGEHVLTGAGTHPHAAIALTEVKVIELPIESVKSQFEAGTQIQKVLMKSFSERTKTLMKEMRSMKLERDNTPCPPDQAAKIFATVFHAAKTKGRTENGRVTCEWPAVKQYAQRVFLESPKRFENAVNIFVKLGAASYEMIKPEDDPEAPEEIGFVHFNDLALVEQFFEFFQYHHYKQNHEILKFDERASHITQVLLELAAPLTPVKNVVRLSYQSVIEKCKTDLHLQLNSDHWTLLERKGLFVKRHSAASEIELHFDRAEFELTAKIWKVLREVDRWNDRGTVDPHEPVDVAEHTKLAGAAAGNCPGCGHGFDAQPKFCSECGHRFAAAA